MKISSSKNHVPFFSIIVPAYNAEKYLPQCLSSVLSQSYGDFEIIVIDNGSNDNTNKLATTILERSNFLFKIIRKKTNVGIAGARNEGVMKARGQFIAFLDADDYWQPDKLKEVKLAIDLTHSSLVCHDTVLVLYDETTKEKKILGKMISGPYKKNMFEYLLLNGNCLFTSAVTVKRTVILGAGLFNEDKKLHGVEDYDLWIRLSQKIPFYFLHKILSEYRIGKYNASGNFERQIENEKEVLSRYVAQITDKPDELLNKRLAIMYRKTGWLLHRQKQFQDAKKWYERSFNQKFLFKTLAAYILATLRINF